MNKTYFPKYFTSGSIMLYLTVLFVCLLVFAQYQLPLIWIVFGLIEVFIFFYFSSTLTKKWLNISENLYRQKVFKTGLMIRVVYVIFAYFFFEIMTGEPFEFSAGDSMAYHYEALWMLDLFDSDQMYRYFDIYIKGYSDMGYPLFLFVFYLLFGSSLIGVRLIFALLGAWMSILIYEFTKRNFDANTARIAGILAMLMPNFILYTGLHLKETLMVFVLVAFFERADYLIRNRSHYAFNLILVCILGISLFFFRTVLGVCALFALFSILAFYKDSVTGWGKRFIIGVWIFVALAMVFPDKISREIDYYLGSSDIHLQAQMDYISSRIGGNEFAKFGRTAIFLPIILIAPFPTLVDTDQPNAMMINGAVFTRNVYAFFVIAALWLIYRRKLFRKHIFIISFLISYLVVLSNSGFAISERFHMPALPFLIILASFGIVNVDVYYKKYYKPYLLMILVLIIFWNWFKLAGRNLI